MTRPTHSTALPNDSANAADTQSIPGRPVRVLACGETQTQGSEWTEHFRVHRDAVLSVSATATGNYNKPDLVTNAGITVRISLDGKPLAADRCFEGESATIDFLASASSTKVLGPGSYTLQVEREDIALEGPRDLTASFVVLDARLA